MKVLGKYDIIKKRSENSFLTECLNQQFVINRIDKNLNNSDVDENFISSKIRNLSSLSHDHLKNLKVDEDEKYFYFIEEQVEDLEKLDSNTFDMKSENYQVLIECYLQILSAIRYIHKQGFYHGNINPNNLLVDINSNKAFLLDFGRAYFYNMLTKDSLNDRFLAPEQITDLNHTSQESDIFSFGLCMLKILLDSFEDYNFEEYYKYPKDLEQIFSAILKNYDLEDVENEIFLLVQQMCQKNPQERISLYDIQIKLENLLDSLSPRNVYEVKCLQKTIDRYLENNSLNNNEDFMEYIKEYTQNHKAYIRKVHDEKRNKEQLEMAINDLVFILSSDENDDYFFCYEIRENYDNVAEKIKQAPLSICLKDEFNFIPERGYSVRNSSNSASLKRILDRKFQEVKLQNMQKKIDKTSIKHEEELLKAEKESIEQKKNTQDFKLKKIEKAADELVFNIVKNNKEQDDDKSQVISKEQEKNFKQGDEVIIENDNSSISIKGKVKKYSANDEELVVKLEKYGGLDIEKELDTKTQYAISYDYQVKEIIWHKKDKALEALSDANVQIPNLLRKINRPRELKQNVLIDIETYFNESLDANQKEAVQKALSLDPDSEILLIQGPPGTGKTTTITEILQQILKRHKHYKILLASQSNQAIDNVLEKICKEEDKIVRIGNDENKISDMAKNYREVKVLNKMLKENRDRIKQNPITHQDKNIDQKLKEFQKSFENALQKTTAKMGKNKNNDIDYEMANLFLKNIRLIFGTLIGISSWQNFREIVFDYAIIDEAGRATLSELLVPCIKARKIILVGDHKQLAPVIDDDIAQNLQEYSKEEVGTSLFERLYERFKEAQEEEPYLSNFYHRLTYNYRATRTICDIYSKTFYDGNLKTTEDIDKERQHNLKCFKSSVVWLDTSKLSNRADEQRGTGKINRCHVDNIEKTLSILLKQIQEVQEVYSIGVITPYKAQKELLENKLKECKKDYQEYYKAQNADSSFDIGTVDSFQGSDRDIIIYDCVRSSIAKNNQVSNKKSKKSGHMIDFIADEKRLNVSLSRAKKLLIIIGDMEYLSSADVKEGENPFTKIIEYIKSEESKAQIIPLSKV